MKVEKMVFESLLKAEDVEKHPWEMFVYSILVTTISLWAAYYVFPTAASIIFIFFIIIALLPVTYKILQEEEELAERFVLTEKSFLERHWHIILVYTAFFLGVLVAASFWYAILPGEFLCSQNPVRPGGMFCEQIKTTEGLNIHVLSAEDFIYILGNNIKVSLLAFLISFFYGTGGLFILTWNASVIAVYVGKLAQRAAETIAGHPLASYYGYAYALPTGLAAIAAHGIFEILAYFTAGIAGGILGIGLIRGKHDVRIIADAFLMYLGCVLLLLIGAIIEVWITPALNATLFIAILLGTLIFSAILFKFKPASQKKL